MKHIDITAQEANEVMYNLSGLFLQNIYYHLSCLKQQEDKERFTYRTMEMAKVILVKMEAIASFLNIQSYVVNLGEPDNNICIDLDTRKPTVERVQLILDSIEV